MHDVIYVCICIAFAGGEDKQLRHTEPSSKLSEIHSHK